MQKIILVVFFFIFCLSYLFTDKLKACYKVELASGKEEVFSPDIYIHGAVWVENGYLIYRPFRAAFYITLKDSVASFKRVNCGRSP